MGNGATYPSHEMEEFLSRNEQISNSASAELSEMPNNGCLIVVQKKCRCTASFQHVNYFIAIIE
jgi:hypothetical protein